MPETVILILEAEFVMPAEANINAAEVYRNFAEYYDAYVGDFIADYQVYLHELIPGMKVLEIGCGTGRVLRPLLEAGASVVGVDISDEMLVRAGDKLRSFIEKGTLQLLNHNFINAPLKELFDRVYVTFYTFNYLLNPDDASLFLKNVRASMNKGAVLVMDLFYPSILHNPDLAGQWQDRVLKMGERQISLSDRRFMQGKVEKREQVFIEDGRKQQITTSRRFYNKKETECLLLEAGFANIKFADGYDMNLFHVYEFDEATNSGFVVCAIK